MESGLITTNSSLHAIQNSLEYIARLLETNRPTAYTLADLSKQCRISQREVRRLLDEFGIDYNPHGKPILIRSDQAMLFFSEFKATLTAPRESPRVKTRGEKVRHAHKCAAQDKALHQKAMRQLADSAKKVQV